MGFLISTKSPACRQKVAPDPAATGAASCGSYQPRWRPARRVLLSALTTLALILPLIPGSRTIESGVSAQPRRPARVYPLAQAASASDQQAVRVLRRALLSASHVAYSGEQTVLTFGEGDGAVSVSQETHLGDGRYRILFRHPENVRGSLQLSDGRQRILYLPSVKMMVVSRLRTPPMSTAAVNAHIAHIRKYYRLRLNPRLDSVEGRSAYRLDLSARYRDRPWQRLWIDRATGLILRRETYSTNGLQLGVSFWRNVQILAHPQMT